MKYSKIYIGHNVNGEATHTMDSVMRKIDLCGTLFGIEAYTAYEALGSWNGEREHTTVVEFIGYSNGIIRALCEELRIILKQNCILEFDGNGEHYIDSSQYWDNMSEAVLALGDETLSLGGYYPYYSQTMDSYKQLRQYLGNVGYRRDYLDNIDYITALRKEWNL